ncbi:hypothetical protein WS70_10505 [Burkholderia mayonis]|uniref:Thioesterase domain-containing protein n=1 Tax=Burkholderia mayonis TaxID=1385591 RepID=A0A1B4FEW2_9BURK|nr:hypothetical protein WS70_10505 [Burkholderia mayonis]KVE34336.1 hypothetical protein WS69_17290 [Burkholderia sp. BDU5]KVE44150.1 hypothetical protein WS70_08355 [Burkholderia mayonis]
MFCLPYAGGAAAIFRDWPRLAPAWLRIAPIHLPGRGVRHHESLIPDWSSLIDRLSKDVQAAPDRPYALFGHSLGALIAFELAHELRRRTGSEPCWLGVSGCVAPRHHAPRSDWLTCSESDVLDELRSFEQTAPELLANREFVELILPVVRNDFHLYGTWRLPRAGARALLRCPVHAFGGSHDDDTRDIATLDAWRDETYGGFERSMFEGGHFFINSHRADLIGTIEVSLNNALSHRTHADIQPVD